MTTMTITITSSDVQWAWDLVEVQRVTAAGDALHLLPGFSRHDLGPEVQQVGQQQEEEEGWAVAQHMVPQLQPVCLGKHLCQDCGHQAPSMRLNPPRTCSTHGQMSAQRTFHSCSSLGLKHVFAILCTINQDWTPALK